ncbi:MAG: PAS domain S-box protein [Actinomycetota bacterium]|nr:PAS domain S-box protein [Actinomycetota bacterium]
MAKEKHLIDLTEFRKYYTKPTEVPKSKYEYSEEAVKNSIAKLQEIATELTHIGEVLQHSNICQPFLAGYNQKTSDQIIPLSAWLEVQQIIDAIPFYVFLVDERHHILMANEAIMHSLSLKPEQVIGKHCPKVIHGLSKPFPGCPLEKSVQIDQAVETELFDSNNGVWLQSVIYPTSLRTQEGWRVYLHMVRDITEQKLAISAMRENNQTLLTLIQASPLAIFALDKENNVTIWNHAAERMFGWSEYEVLGQPLPPIDKSNGEQKRRTDAARERILRGESFTDVELIGQRKDGSLIDVSASAAPLYDGDSNISGIMVIAADITEKKRADEEFRRSLETLKRNFSGIVEALSSIAEKRDPYTAGHQRRVAKICLAIAREMGLPEDQIEGLVVAATLHDIGKVSTPVEILTKPSKLTELEFNLIKGHPQHGYDILKTVEFPWPVAKIVLQHHERMNGSGYPSGLQGEDILLEARILAVADVVEAMISHRPYRPSHGLEKALAEIYQNKGILYDSQVVDACLRLASDSNQELWRI